MNSMTGYGRAVSEIGGYEISVEIKSVNHRYFEPSLRVPRIYLFLEEKVKSLLQSKISRGKIDVNVFIKKTDGSDVTVKIDGALASQYIDALRGVSDELSLQDDLRLSALLRFNDIFSVDKAEEDEEAITSAVLTVAEEAFDSFNEMRKTEGEKLKADVLSRIAKIESLSADIDERTEKSVEAYRERLFKKLSEVLENRNIDEARILQEAAIFSDKVCVSEETVRLKSHIAQFREIAEKKEPVGKKLDFLVQEINREINTTGSKCQDITITQTVIDLKSEVEKIREQIQNVE